MLHIQKTFHSIKINILAATINNNHIKMLQRTYWISFCHYKVEEVVVKVIMLTPMVALQQQGREILALVMTMYTLWGVHEASE